MWTLGSCNLPEQGKLGQMSWADKKDMHVIKDYKKDDILQLAHFLVGMWMNNMSDSWKVQEERG